MLGACVEALSKQLVDPCKLSAVLMNLWVAARTSEWFVSLLVAVRHLAGTLQTLTSESSEVSSSISKLCWNSKTRSDKVIVYRRRKGYNFWPFGPFQIQGHPRQSRHEHYQEEYSLFKYSDRNAIEGPPHRPLFGRPYYLNDRAKGLWAHLWFRRSLK